MNETTPTLPENPPGSADRILVLAPDQQLTSAIVTALNEAAPGKQVDVAHSLEEAQRLVVGARPILFVLDVDATYDLGQEFLYDLRTSHPDARAIVLTAIHLPAYREQAAGLGAIHFLEKPFPHRDFVDLVQALLQPSGKPDSEKFQGTLSELHIADIIQLKCMSGTSSALEFTGPQGEKARVFFENGQVRHATAPGKEGIAAFNEIVNWKGGMISEVTSAAESPRTINLDWQVLLMEAVRKQDEARNVAPRISKRSATKRGGRKILVIDDSLMLLSFVNEILTEANYQVATAPTAEEGLRLGASEEPDLILLDYVLPDMKGDEVTRRLSQDPATADIPIIYMSGFGTDLQPDESGNSSVIGSLNKPFTSELLIKTVENFMPKQPGEEEIAPAEAEPATEIPSAWETNETRMTDPIVSETAVASVEAPISSGPTEPAAVTPGGAESAPWWSPPASSVPLPQSESSTPPDQAGTVETPPTQGEAFPMEASSAYFCGDTSFFSLNWALHTIAKQKLTGTLRSFWDKETVDLLAQKGRILLATTRDPELYCPEAPITLVNVDAERAAQARAVQRETGCPLFLTLAKEELILREPALQLVQHYGQKLFAQLWTAKRVRFLFEQSASVPDFAQDITAEDDIDHWALGTLRFIQFQELSGQADFDPKSIPAYTRDGFERIQNLRLTVAEAQFASQFNGVRSIQQIAKNLRLDLKFARLTLFRFLALEIVECWPHTSAQQPEGRGFFKKLGLGG